MQSDEEEIVPARIEWVGDSLKALKSFPRAIQYELGGDIWKLQIGKLPTNFRSMKSIGQGVFELRQRDKTGWYRVIYVSKVGNTIYVLHSFVKKSAKTSRKDLDIATTRLKAVRKLIQEKKQ